MHQANDQARSAQEGGEDEETQHMKKNPRNGIIKSKRFGEAVSGIAKEAETQQAGREIHQEDEPQVQEGTKKNRAENLQRLPCREPILIAPTRNQQEIQ